MKTGLVTSLALFSAALTVIVVIGWIRSLVSTDLISYQYARQTSTGLHLVLYQYGASGGGNFIKWYEATYPTIRTSSPRSSNDGWQWSVLPAPGRRFFGGLGGGSLTRTLGFSAFSGHSVPVAISIAPVSLTVRTARFPHWFVLLLTLPLLALSLRRVMHDRHRIRRRRMGLCERCGYDLRVTPNVCPECGMRQG